MRRFVAAFLGLLLLPCVLGLAPQAHAAIPVSVTFTYNGTDGTDGSPQTWTVPTGVKQATFVLEGASGGDSRTSSGGHGATVSASLVVSPGQDYVLVVGGRPPGDGKPVGGYNGGGGNEVTSQTDPTFGAGGGGSTELRLGNLSSDRLLVAGGGGGAGGAGETLGPPTGGAGGDAGLNGQDAPADSLAGGGGGGVAGCLSGQATPPCGQGGSPGSGDPDGLDGTGQEGSPTGRGGDISLDLHAGWGGGGGGGWHGGGSGGSGGYRLEGATASYSAGGGGGGGGSSHVTAVAMSSSPTQPRTDHGHGRATISFTAPEPDSDSDGVVDAKDRCVAVAASDPTGCPVLARTIGIGYGRLFHRFGGRVSSAEQACVAHRTVTLWRAVPGPDRRVGTTTTRADGSWRVRLPLRFGPAYYSRTAKLLLPEVGICAEAVSRKLKRIRG